MTDFASLSDFARRVPGEVAATSLGLAKAVQAEIARRALPYARAITPVGGVLSRDRHPGQMKGSWNGGVNVIGGWVATDAPYGAVIDRGRKRGFTKRGEERKRFKKGEKKRVNKAAPMLGSKQAPRGILRPVVDRIFAEQDAIVDRAGREVAD